MARALTEIFAAIVMLTGDPDFSVVAPFEFSGVACSSRHVCPPLPELARCGELRGECAVVGSFEFQFAG